MSNLGILVPIMGMMIPIVAIVMTNWSKVQNRRMDLMEKGSTERTRIAEARIEKLEARIAVLERIATDKRLALADEIDALGREDLFGGREPSALEQKRI